MQRVTMVQYTCKPECVDENVALSRAVFKALQAKAPGHVSYSLFQDGNAFVHLFVNLAEDSSDVLTDLPAFKAYTKDIAARCIAPPAVQRFAVEALEAYGFRDAIAGA